MNLSARTNIENKELDLIKGNDDFFDDLKVFMEELKTKFPWIDFKVKKGKNSKIEFNDLSFYGVPEGHLLDYFIKFINLPQIKSQSKEFDQSLFVSSMCPNCPKALDSLIKFLEKNTIKTNIYFCDHSLYYSQKYNVMSVPCLLIKKDNKEIQRLVGDLSIDDLEVVFKEKNKEELSSKYFQNIIEQGNAEEIAEMILSEKKVFSGFVSLFFASTMSLRVGAVVAGEYLIEKSADLFEELIEKLYENYLDSSVEIKGDILYLLSLSENKSKWIKELENIRKNETNILLIEMIDDSLETLNN